MRRVSHLAAAVLIALQTLGVPARVRAAPPAASEYELKAAFLYNFAKFVEWPPEALAASEAGIRVCILGDDPFGELLDRTLAGKTVHERPLAVSRVEEMSATNGCHILFVSALETRRLQRVSPPAGTAMLTVGETEDFLRRGGIVSFEMDQNRLRFEINAEAADDAGLKISSQLMKLATRIVRNPS